MKTETPPPQVELTEEQTAAVRAHAERMIAQEYQFLRETQPARFAAATAEMRAEFEKRQHAEALRDASIILSPRHLWEVARRGAFHPSNKSWRALLGTLHGVQLPPGAGATHDAVRALVGPSWDVWENEKREAAERAENEKREAAEVKERARIDVLKVKIAAGESVTGDELADVGRSLGIDIHPRTVGTLRKRVNWIGDSGARVTGKGGLPDGVWSLYHDVRAKLAPAPVS